jgi:histidinol-phosphate aminotransferase
MESLNRRNWLKLAGLAGTATLLEPLESWIDPYGLSESNTGISENFARLNYNENPFAPSLKVKNAIINSFQETCRYPGTPIRMLAQKIAIHEGVKPENIVVTGGSREGLKAAGLVYGLEGNEIITCVPTYYALLSYAENFGAYVNKVPLKKNLEYNLEGIDQRISSNTSMVFICNPNNPTGSIVDPIDLEKFCETNATRTMVFVDEVYKDYITDPNYPTMSSLIKKGLNVIISRTFSKVYGLAGLRVGYLIAREDIAKRLRSALQAGSNVLAVNAALASLEDQEFYSFSLAKNNEAKEYIYKILDEIGLEYIRSHANFVFFHSGMEINVLITNMKNQNVLIGRPFPPLLDWCRVSTGKMVDVEKFGKALKHIYS